MPNFLGRSLAKYGHKDIEEIHEFEKKQLDLWYLYSKLLMLKWFLAICYNTYLNSGKKFIHINKREDWDFLRILMMQEFCELHSPLNFKPKNKFLH